MRKILDNPDLMDIIVMCTMLYMLVMVLTFLVLAGNLEY